jgi:hypothetical protein
VVASGGALNALVCASARMKRFRSAAVGRNIRSLHRFELREVIQI